MYVGMSPNHRPQNGLLKGPNGGDFLLHRGATHGELHDAVAHTVAVHGAAGDQLQGLQTDREMETNKNAIRGISEYNMLFYSIVIYLSYIYNSTNVIYYIEYMTL